jgi:hypothetical protein
LYARKSDANCEWAEADDDFIQNIFAYAMKMHHMAFVFNLREKMHLKMQLNLIWKP